MTDFAKIELGLNLLLKKDAYLLQHNLSERSITHKLGEYYQLLFPEWNVDCEYNKNLGEIKKINIHPKQLLLQMASYLEKQDGFRDIRHNEDFLPFDFIPNLINQLKNPKIKYIRELDLYFFLLKLINGKFVKKTIYPDIIIHHRGTSDNNIVFEVKKSSNNCRESRLYDMAKLATLITSTEYNYKKGVFIDLPVTQNFSNFKSFQRQRMFNLNLYEYLPKYI